MMMNNFIAGPDGKGKELRSGDICSFVLPVVTKRKTVERKMKGLISYSQNDFAYVFLTLDETAPEIYMHVVPRHSIEYEVSICSGGFKYRDGDCYREATYCSDDEASKWRRLYMDNIDS